METILLIEKDGVKLVTLALVLRCFGYPVLEAGSRGEAWSACNEHHGPIHVAILGNDITSEFVTGLLILCRLIRALFVSDANTSGIE